MAEYFLRLKNASETEGKGPQNGDRGIDAVWGRNVGYKKNGLSTTKRQVKRIEVNEM